jgi:resolvase-like protein
MPLAATTAAGPRLSRDRSQGRRLTRSLADFAKLVELFDARAVSFVSVTQRFNTTSSMGRLTLNVLLSFAQLEREVTGERIRDKIAVSSARAVGRRHGTAGLREPGQQALHRRGGGRARPHDLLALSRARLFEICGLRALSIQVESDDAQCPGV